MMRDQLNAPFELKPKQKPPKGKYQHGVLLVHGFLDTPYTLRAIGNIYQSQGFFVTSIVLPGHGSQPEDLEHIALQDWHDAVDKGIEALSTHCVHVHLCGFSLGGALTYLAAQRHEIASLCLLAPAFEISKTTALTLPFVSWFAQTPFGKKLRWIHLKHQPMDVARYNHFPVKTAQFVNQIVGQAKRQLASNHIACPLFVGAVFEDETVQFDKIYHAFQHAAHSHKTAVCFTSGLPDQANYPDIEFIQTKNSHISLPIAPEDEHLGEQATQNASINDLSYHRLTYNKRFDLLENALRNWLMGL